MLNLLADIAIAIGTKCADRADYLKIRREIWIGRGCFWSDVARWFRLRCIKPFAEIRAERKGAAS